MHVEREVVTKKVNDARFASLGVYGATDSAIQEQDITFVRTCQAGKIEVSFLGIVNTPKADATGVTASIVHAVQSGLSVPMHEFNKKFVAIATDGAAVMTGQKAGVVAKLKKNSSSFVGIHCFAHRLELACRDVVKGHPSYQELDKFLLDLFLFYHNRCVKFCVKMYSEFI